MSESRRPNFLFLLSDQQRFDFVGLNPDLPVRSPNVDDLSRRGVTFTNAFCPSPLCAPSRACLASGKSYRRTGVFDNNYDYDFTQPTYYGALRESGYRVAGAGKFDLHKKTKYWGLDGSRLLKEWGFTEGVDSEGKWNAVVSGAEVPKGPYMAYLHDRGLADTHVRDYRRRRSGPYADTYPTPLPEEAYGDNWITENAISLLRGFPRDQPWHLVVNFAGPHDPMDVTERMRRRWKAVDFPAPIDSSEFDAQTHARIRQNYAAMIENIDTHVGRMLEIVDDRGEWDDTLVVYSSDHGEMLGDHDLWGKQTYYHPSVSVPMIIAGPGVREGIVSDALVSLHDLAATFIDYASARTLPDMDSLSLRPVLEGQRESHRAVVVSELDSWRMIFDGRYKLVLEDGAQPLLFDLLEDPSELVNVAGSNGAEVERLTRALEKEAMVT